MLKEIKRAKFLVSDFTQQKQGVYFEAGYALGLGRYVIYMSNKNDFRNCHFDTKSFPHIVYENLEELGKKLEDKIEAYLK